MTPEELEQAQLVMRTQKKHQGPRKVIMYPLKGKVVYSYSNRVMAH